MQHDRDTKFTAKFDDTLRGAGGKVFKSPFRSPNLTAYVERVIQTLRVEALDHFLFFGQKHLDYVLLTFAQFYNQHRISRKRISRFQLPTLLKPTNRRNLLKQFLSHKSAANRNSADY